MGEEIPWDEVPEARAIDLHDYFKPVKISPKAIDRASMIVPEQYWKATGIYTWLSRRANHVFGKLPSDKTEGQSGRLKYFFEYTADGPALRDVRLLPPSVEDVRRGASASTESLAVSDAASD